jgi:pimeloyl-ACP methyl ester carboxylesterase
MEQQILFTNPQGEKLAGILACPLGAERFPLVILAHGYGTSKGSYTNSRVAQALVPHGIGTFRFDFSGHGESEGSIADLTLTKAIAEVGAAVQQLAGLEQVDQNRIGLLGSSFGGNVMLLYAARFGGAKALALKSPISNYCEVRELQLGADKILLWKQQGWIELWDGIRSNYEFYQDASRIDTLAEARQIECPVLVVQGDQDEDIPMRHTEQLSKALGKKGRLEIVAGADHAYTHANHFEQAINSVANFLLAHLP